MTTAEIRAAHAKFLADQIKPTTALTLVYNDTGISRARIVRDLRDLHADIDRRLYGRRYYKRPPSMRSQFWAVIEMQKDYPHVHVGWQLPKDGDAVLIHALKTERIWLRFAPRGHYDIRDYQPGWEAYSTKHLTDSNEIVMSSELSADT